MTTHSHHQVVGDDSNPLPRADLPLPTLSSSPYCCTNSSSSATFLRVQGGALLHFGCYLDVETDNHPRKYKDHLVKKLTAPQALPAFPPGGKSPPPSRFATGPLGWRALARFVGNTDNNNKNNTESKNTNNNNNNTKRKKQKIFCQVEEREQYRFCLATSSASSCVVRFSIFFIIIVF